ncbi:hypothetical protein GUJ93_ZPchr0001g30535 [Zizania palustris]|uniref:Uncharacterized protein n=1 Tax=Zizania palustris TaxID=103762 RepID=A0A8J5SE45_ZIZPA|nr:hypothetical protein GUJ93_ZPchr0001g30535 [Zizania palustris]
MCGSVPTRIQEPGPICSQDCEPAAAQAQPSDGEKESKRAAARSITLVKTFTSASPPPPGQQQQSQQPATAAAAAAATSSSSAALGSRSSRCLSPPLAHPTSFTAAKAQKYHGSRSKQ